MAGCCSAALFGFNPLILLSFSLIRHLLDPSTAFASTCTGGGGGGTGTYKTCVALPQLGATLRYSYVPSTAMLSLSYHAQPAAPAGWVAWGINPRAPRMLGTQALLAFRRSDGSVGAATFNISAYYPVAPSPISYDVIGLEATDAGGGEMGLSATVRLPPGTARVFQAWQVGPAVSAGGMPVGHYFGEDNLASVGVLDLMQGVTRGTGGG